MNSEADRSADHQARAASTFVELIDTLVDDFDVIDVLTVLASRSVELLDAAAAGILLVDSYGELRVMAASTEEIGVLELLQVQNEQGPCMDCFRSGQIVVATDLTSNPTWPLFAAESTAAGYLAVCAVPLRLREVVLGCLNLFLTEPVGLTAADINLAQALADVASIAIIQDQAARDAALREGRLQHALDSRIAIEQAKGMLAERGAVDMDEAFTQLRNFARSTNRGLTEVAESLIAGRLTMSALLRARRPAPRRPTTS